MTDSIHHKQLRQNLVRKIALKGINDPKVLDAIAAVPRHLFLDNPYMINEAYEDVALSIGAQQTISQPFTVAYQTQLLNLQSRDKVLEIGTGSGYQAAVLFELGAGVYSLERQKELFSKTKGRLLHLGYSAIHLFLKDGTNGLPEEAPFDKILVTAGAVSIPGALIEQLKPGGTMVIPVGEQTQKMLRITKGAGNQIAIEEFEHFRFVPFLGGTTED